MIRCYGCMELYEDNIEHICPCCGYCQDAQTAIPIHIQPGSVLADRYIIGAVKGFGGFGVTYLGWDTYLNIKVAIKEYLPSEFSTRAPGQTQVTVFSGDKREQYTSGMSKFINEAKNLARFTSCSGIVQVYDSFEDNDTAYIVMEYLDGISLKEYLNEVGTVNSEDAVDMMLPIMKSLESVNKEGIIHRDIAPDNIMITENGDFKLIDFGAARYATTSHSRSLSVLIKQGFSPEEQYTSHGEQGPHTDVYAMGATLYKMITGITPPEALARRAELETKGRDILEPLSKYCKDIPENIENAIINAMNVKAEDRTPNMEEFIHELTTDEIVKLRKNSIRVIDIYRWPLWAKITVPTLAVSIVALIILFSTGVIGFKSTLNSEMYTPEGMVRVPSVVNYSIDEAEELLKEKRLTYVVKDKMYSDLVEKDKILSQATIAGSLVGENSKLDIVICGGVETVELPSVRGREYDEIAAELQLLGLIVNVVEEYSDVIAKGSVIDIDAKFEDDGTAIKGSAVTIVVSKGVDPSIVKNIEKKEVPNFVGHTQEEAIDLATDASFALKFEYSYSADVAVNVVMLQSEESGAFLDNDTVIILTLSLGQNLTKVPDVQYKEEKIAKDEIVSKGLKYEIEYIESEKVAVGHVISQSISAGEKVVPDTVIKLQVSSGAGKIDVPNVTGLTESEARNILTSNGFVVATTLENNSTVKEGLVISQDVVGKKKASKGDTIILKISSGEVLITVPNFVGETRENAEATAKNLGLSIVVVERNSMDIAKGNVMSQSVQAGTRVKAGSEITIDVSLGVLNVRVPNVIGSDRISAVSAIESAGLICNVSVESSDRVDAGKVINTTPSGGTAVDYGSIVGVVVSSGPKYVYVYFDGNGGTSSSGSVQVEIGSNYSTSGVSASRDNYIFDGWYDSANGGTKIDNITVSSGITLYAHWVSKGTFTSYDVLDASKYRIVSSTTEYRYTFNVDVIDSEKSNYEAQGYSVISSYNEEKGYTAYSDWMTTKSEYDEYIEGYAKSEKKTVTQNNMNNPNDFRVVANDWVTNYNESTETVWLDSITNNSEYTYDNVWEYVNPKEMYTYYHYCGATWDDKAWRTAPYSSQLFDKGPHYLTSESAGTLKSGEGYSNYYVVASTCDVCKSYYTSLEYDKNGFSADMFGASYFFYRTNDSAPSITYDKITYRHTRHNKTVKDYTLTYWTIYSAVIEGTNPGNSGDAQYENYWKGRNKIYEVHYKMQKITDWSTIQQSGYDGVETRTLYTYQER